MSKDPFGGEIWPDWLDRVINRVGDIVAEPAHRERFRVMLQRWVDEHRAKAPLPRPDEGDLGRPNPIEIPAVGRLTLPEEYAILSAVHDNAAKAASEWGLGGCERFEPIHLWEDKLHPGDGDRAAKEDHDHMGFIILQGQLRDEYAELRERIEEALRDVDADLAEIRGIDDPARQFLTLFKHIANRLGEAGERIDLTITAECDWRMPSIVDKLPPGPFRDEAVKALQYLQEIHTEASVLTLGKPLAPCSWPRDVALRRGHAMNRLIRSLEAAARDLRSQADQDAAAPPKEVTLELRPTDKRTTLDRLPRSAETQVEPTTNHVPNDTEQAVIDYLFKEGIVDLDVLRVIDRDNRPTGERIAPRAIGRSCDGQFKATLSSMVKCGWLGNGRRHGQRSGYFLTPSGKALARTHRKSGPGQD